MHVFTRVGLNLGIDELHNSLILLFNREYRI